MCDKLHSTAIALLERSTWQERASYPRHSSTNAHVGFCSDPLYSSMATIRMSMTLSFHPSQRGIPTCLFSVSRVLSDNDRLEAKPQF